jgi:uncharacterized repeat protein (TIGR01451 family)
VADDCAYVFIVANTPISATNGQASNVRLTAVVAVAGTLGVTPELEDNGVDGAMTVEVVWGDAGEDATEFADDQYHVQTAAMSVRKTSTVISDPFNGGTNPKSIPGAVMEYGIELTNSGTVDATVVTITDPIPATTTFSVANPYNAGASNVSIQVGAAPATFCLAEAGGVDGNGDGCVRTAGGVVTVGAPALGSIAFGGTVVTVRFRVTIN